MSRLVWLFSAHRELMDAYKAQDKALALLVERNLQLESDNKKLTAAVEEAQRYFQSNPNQLQSVMDMYQRYQEQVLQDLPYDNGQIPAEAWLTPGTLEPVRTDG